MAEVREAFPIRHLSVCAKRVRWSVCTAVAALLCVASAGRASTRPPLNGLPIVHPGLGVPDEPDAPAQGGMLKPVYRPTLTGFATTPRGGTLSISHLQTVRTFKARRFWR